MSSAPRRVQIWNPDSRRGEESGLEKFSERKEIWFLAVLFLLVLVIVIWQNNAAWRLSSEMALLESQRDALRNTVLQLGTELTELQQPDFLLAGLSPGEKHSPDLSGRVMVPADPLPRSRRASGGEEQWLASLGLAVPSALASESP